MFKSKKKFTLNHEKGTKEKPAQKEVTIKVSPPTPPQKTKKKTVNFSSSGESSTLKTDEKPERKISDISMEFDNEFYDPETTSDDRRMSSGSDIIDEEPPAGPFRRRQSVFAEAYDPEEDDDEEDRVVHAKSDDQRKRLGESVKNIFLFRSLDPDQINEVIDAMFERKVTAGEDVILQNHDGDNFYVIDSGVYNIYVSNSPGAEPLMVGKYDNTGYFGELALMYNQPRAATIRATSAGTLWAMNRITFRRILLKSACKKRKMYEGLLEKVPMLKTLKNYERMSLSDALTSKTFSDGDLIIRQGAAADGMYFVEDGEVRITMTNSDNEEKEISRVGFGGCFGELALVTKKPRAASVYAQGKVRLAFLDVEAFERLLGPCMDLMKRNIDDYENELLKIFGSKANITDIR